MKCYLKYRMRNTTQNSYEYVWALETDPAPTVLPENPLDSVGEVVVISEKCFPFNPGDAIDLDKAKELKAIEIDVKTGQLIQLGFQYDGKTFSASSHAQRNAEAALTKKDTLTYPFDWSTMDNLDKVTIDSAATLTAFEDALFTTVKGHWDSGNGLKSHVRAAVDIAAVNAVADNR